MKTVTITLQIPDGVAVSVNQSGQQQQGNSDFVPRPDPDYPDAPCAVCGNDWRLIKAGFSKTKKNADGSPKRFNAFYVCATEGCDGKPGESVVEAILYILWDLRQKVGHATRSVDECLRQAREDITIRTSLLEGRYILGDEALFEDMRTRFEAEVVRECCRSSHLAIDGFGR
jgi:hypothetical protein